VDRREFLRLTGIGLGSLVVPVLGRPVPVLGAVTAIPALDRKQLADLALEAAATRGASYADVRIGRYRNEFVITREDRVQNLVSTESFGAGIRVLSDGTWGFAATPDVTPDGLAKAAARAVAIAKANARIQIEPVRLAPAKAWGQVAWKTPIRKNAFDVPIGEKVELLLEVNARAREAGARFVNSMLFLVNEHKFFASTDGTWADQDIHRIWPNFTVTGVDPASGRFQTRNALSEPMGMGWEYLDGAPTGKVFGVTTRYGSSYDMLEDAANAGREVNEKLVAKPVEAGTYDLVLDPSHLWLTIHESVGHPLELDRVLGYEANFAGTSFATLDKWRSGSFRYGSEIVTFFADRIQAGSLAAAGWDDEGVRTKRWDLVKDGILVDYQKTRDQAHILGQEEGDGSSYADSWSSVQFQRMPNVSLAPGKAPLTVDELIRGVEKGIYILGRGSYSIDQQRYNFQFGGQLFYEIRDGKITGMLRDVAYQSNTQEFWNACVRICDHRDYRLGGSFFDGKGEPGQVSAVSHGCATSRFDDVTVINTERSL
jgi:TldD protein